MHGASLAVTLSCLRKRAEEVQIEVLGVLRQRLALLRLHRGLVLLPDGSDLLAGSTNSHPPLPIRDCLRGIRSLGEQAVRRCLVCDRAFPKKSFLLAAAMGFPFVVTAFEANAALVNRLYCVALRGTRRRFLGFGVLAAR